MMLGKCKRSQTAGSLVRLQEAPLQPHASNARVACDALMEVAEQAGAAPLFAAEQEYCIEEDEDLCCAHQALCRAAEQAEPDAAAWPHAHLPDPTKPLYGPNGTRALGLQRCSSWHPKCSDSSCRNAPHTCMLQCTGGMAQLAQVPPAPGVQRSAALARAAAARRLSEAHVQLCLHAGLKLSACGEGDHAGLWSYKLGPLPGTELGDQLWISRHLLIRLSEAMGIPVSFGDINGDSAAASRRALGCYIKLSTAASRQPGSGLAILQQYLGRLQATHVHYLQLCGRGSKPGAAAVQVELPACSVGGVCAPLVLPTSSVLRGAGHLLDRRGAANADPWLLAMCVAAAALDLRLPLLPAATNAVTAAAATATLPQQQQQLVGSADSARSHLLLAASLGLGALHAAAPAGDAAANITAAACSESGPAHSLTTEDVLLQELDRRDGELCCCVWFVGERKQRGRAGIGGC
jgi:glutamine synthetase